uniref:NAC transcription factor n=1 Tax=Suaeda liaotungensis TaxID=154002 RepID=A0A0M5L8A3_9CARY|nr:NAC transcription factor [Suaeda liaotungensis]
MCPPGPSSSDIGAYWTDEDLIVSLDKFQSGSPLPSNVIADVDPFVVEPSNLPCDVWFFVCTDNQKETTTGSWKVKGDGCEIYSNSKLTGWRTTLEYCEDQSNEELKTEWVMQEYWITLKGSNNLKESGSLCRVFACDGGCRKLKRQRHGSPLAEEHNICDQKEPTKNSQVILQHDEIESSDCAVNQNDIDCFSTGDYIELLDLENPRSSSSSSDNSSCLSMASDEFFDYLALNDLEPENCKEVQSQSTSSNLNVMTSAIPDDIIMCPAPIGTVIAGEASQSATEKSPENENEENSLQAPPLQAKLDENKDGTKHVASTSDEASTSERSVPDKGKKTLGKMKMIRKKYLCFMPF